MDPTTSLIISSAIGGAAGSFIKEISSNGVKWLIELVTAQSPEMQAAAKKIELIAQRLTANADDMIALAGAAACSVVISLSSRQIKILAVLSTVKSIRTSKKINITEIFQAKTYINKYWKDNIEPLIVDGNLGQATQLDYEHLAAMGCIRISIGSQELAKVVSIGIVEPEANFSGTEFKGQPWYDALEKQWVGLGHSTPSSIGQLIGILHRDAKLNTKTQINW